MDATINATPEAIAAHKAECPFCNFWGTLGQARHPNCNMLPHRLRGCQVTAPRLVAHNPPQSRENAMNATSITTATLSKAALLAHHFASSDPHRPGLHSVHVRPDGAAEATDGHVAVIVAPHSDEMPGPDSEMMIPAKLAKAATKSAGKGIGGCVAEVREGADTKTVTLSANGSSVSAQAPEEAFPKLAGVIPPADRDGFRIKFDPRVLGDALLALADMMDADADRKIREYCVSIDFGAPHQAARIVAETDHRTITALVMPRA